MPGKQARCDSNPVVHPLIVPGPANGMQRTGFLVRQAVLRESVDVVQELLHLLFLLEQVPGPGVASGIRCKSASAGSDFMIRLCSGSDSFWLFIGLGRCHSAWP